MPEPRQHARPPNSGPGPGGLLAALEASWPPAAWRDVTVVVAVSGGTDSVALLRGLAWLREHDPDGPGQGRLVAAHYHHGLRGAAADEDARFVEQVCHTLGLECRVGRAAAGSWSGNTGDGLEAAARAARYHFLQATAEELGARYVAAAHTADDQAETILHRIVRGTGLAGLAGMPRARPLGPAVTLIRPLLDCRRRDLAAWLAAVGQSCREDASNLDLALTRNRLRHDLLPKLAAEYNPQVVDALLRLGALARQAQALIDGLVDPLLDQCVRDGGAQRVEIPDVRPLQAADRYLLRELLVAIWRRRRWPLQAMGHVQWEQLAGLAAGPADGQLSLPGNIIARRQGIRLDLAAPPAAALRPEAEQDC